MRPCCLLRRVRQLTADQEERPEVQECLEAAFSRAHHLDHIGFFKSLLPFGGGRGALARGRVRLARAVARWGPTWGRRRAWRPVAIVRRGRVRRVGVVVVSRRRACSRGGIIERWGRRGVSRIVLADGLVFCRLARLLDVLGLVARLAARLRHTAFLLVGVDLAQGLEVVDQLVIGSRQRLVSRFLGRKASLKCFNGHLQALHHLHLRGGGLIRRDGRSWSTVRWGVGGGRSALPPPSGRLPVGNLPSLARRVPLVPPVDILGPEQSVLNWLTPCAPTSKISTVMFLAPRSQVDGLRPARQATVSTPSQCQEAARKFLGTPCGKARWRRECPLLLHQMWY